MQSTDLPAAEPQVPLPPPAGPPAQRQEAELPTDSPTPPFEQLLARLEEGYEFHTMQLARLNGAPDGSGRDFGQRSLAAASRRALTVIAAALRDMAEGRYGTCASCGQPIPLERLQARPEARHCLRCQAAGIA